MGTERLYRWATTTRWSRCIPSTTRTTLRRPRARPDRRDQLGPRGGPDRPGRRRRDRPRVYTGIGGQMDFAGSQPRDRMAGGDRAPSTAEGGTVLGSGRSCSGRQRRDDARPRATSSSPSTASPTSPGRTLPRARQGARRDRPSRLPRGAHRRGTRAPPDLTAAHRRIGSVGVGAMGRS